MSYTPIYDTFATKPKSQYLSNLNAVRNATIRDNFTIYTWLAVGALIQGLVCLLPYRNIALVTPVVLVLLYKVTYAILMTVGVLPNKYMDRVVPGRSVVLYPDESGKYEKPADKQVCTVMVAAQTNHPLGILDSGFRETGNFLTQMCNELNENAGTNGFLGSSAWISVHDREAGNENMAFLYFDSLESLAAYTHGPLHSQAMEWWVKHAAKYKHLALMHEVFVSPKNSWEGIYLNYAPTGLGRTSTQSVVDGKKVWMNPLVQGKGKLRYTAGRLGRPFGDKEWSASTVEQ